LQEDGSTDIEFYLKSGILFAKGYIRIVYGDHGPYIEFAKENIKIELVSKFNNVIDYDELPDDKFYYYWLKPKDNDLKVYLQLKPVTDLPNAPKRADGKKSDYNRQEGYADYKRGFFYVSPYDLTKQETK